MRQFAILFFLIVVLAGCGDGFDLSPFNPADAAQIEGVWQRETVIGEQVYWFASGRMIAETFFSGQSVAVSDYSFRTSADTVSFREIHTGAESAWIVRFSDENTLQARSTQDSFALVFQLRRL